MCLVLWTASFSFRVAFEKNAAHESTTMSNDDRTNEQLVGWILWVFSLFKTNVRAWYLPNLLRELCSRWQTGAKEKIISKKENMLKKNTSFKYNLLIWWTADFLLASCMTYIVRCISSASIVDGICYRIFPTSYRRCLMDEWLWDVTPASLLLTIWCYPSSAISVSV